MTAAQPARRIVSITDGAGQVIEPSWLARALPVHRQLRPKLPEAYADKMRRVFAEGGRMCLAADGEQVVGVAVYRVFDNTHHGRRLYVDDLVSDENRRSHGVGKFLLDYLESVARAEYCHALTLDSGTQRVRAHKFYFREGWVVDAFKFEKILA